MPWEVHRTNRFKRSYKKLPPHIQDSFDKKIKIFSQDPFFPLLETHKLHGNLDSYYTFYLKDGFRVLFEFQNNSVALLVNIGNHNDYERWARSV